MKKHLLLATIIIAALGLYADAFTFTAGEDIPLGTASGDFADYVTASGTGKMDSSDYHVGSTKAGFTMTVSLNNSTAGDYVLSVKGGTKNFTAVYTVTVADGSDYSRSRTVNQGETSNWALTQQEYMLLDSLPEGELTLTFAIDSTAGSYGGNYGYFRITGLADAAFDMADGALDLTGSYVSLTGSQLQDNATYAKQIAYNKTGNSFSFLLYASKCAKYGFSYVAASYSNATDIEWSLVDEDGEVWTATNSISATGTLSESFGLLDAGLYTLTGTFSSESTGYLGNYANFVFSQTFCTVTAADVENATVSVTTNGVAVTGKDGVYTVEWGADVVVTYTADEGYALIGDSVFTYEGMEEAQTVTAPAVNVTGSFTSGTDIEVAAYDSDTKTSTAKGYVVLSGCSPDTYYQTNYIIGNSHADDYFVICLNNETAGDYYLAWKGAASGFEVTYKVTVSSGGTTLLEETYTQQNTSNWYPSTEQKELLENLPAGAFTIRFDLLTTTGSYAGNYGFFSLTEYVKPNYSITAPSIDNATVAVTVDDEEIEGEDGVYAVTEGDTVVITYTAEEGYALSGTSSWTIEDVSEDTEITAPTAVPVWTIDAGEYIPLGETKGSFTNYVSTSGTLSMDSSAYHVGSTKSGAALTVNIYNGTEGDYVLTMLGGASGLTATYTVSITDGGSYTNSITVTQQNTGSWTPSQLVFMELDDLPEGLLYLDFAITSSSGSYGGNYGYFTIDTAEDGVITMPTTAVVDFSNSAARTSATVQSDTTVVGSTGNGSTISFIVSAEATAQYGMTFKHGSNGSYAPEIEWTLCNTLGEELAVLGVNSLSLTGSWTPSVEYSQSLGTLAKGMYIVKGAISVSSGYAGNYGSFEFTKTAVTTYTIAVPDVEGATATVTVNDIELAQEDGSYVVAEGATAVVTYTANDGYYFADGQTTEFMFSDISADVEDSAYEGKLPTATANPTLTIPVRDNATRVVYVNDEEVDNDTDTFSVQPNSTVTVSYAGSASGTPYGLYEFDLGAIGSTNAALAESSVPLYFKDETVTTNITGEIDVILYASYNTSLTLDCDWSGLAGTVYVYGAAGYVKFGESYSGSANADWVVDDQLDLTSLSEATLKFKSLAYSSMQRIFMKNGEQSVTFEIGGDDDFTCAANAGFGSDHWSREPNESASVTVKKVGSGKMTTNLAGAREWVVSEGEVAFVPLTDEAVNDTRYLYVTNCNTITVKDGATVSGFYGATEDSGLAAGKLSALVLEEGSTFSPTVGKTWNVTSLSLNGATVALKAPATGLVYGKTYTLLEAASDITGTPVDASDDFTITVDGTNLLATYTGMGAWVVASNETYTYTAPETNSAVTMATSEGIVIEEGGRLVVNFAQMDFPGHDGCEGSDGTLSLPAITLPDGADFTNCVSVVYPSGYGVVSMVATDGYGYLTLDAASDETPASVYTDSSGNTVAGSLDDVIAAASQDATESSYTVVTVNEAVDSVRLAPGVTLSLASGVDEIDTDDISVYIGSIDATSYYTALSWSGTTLTPVLDETVVKPGVDAASDDTAISADGVSLGVSNVKAGLYYGLQSSGEAASGYADDAGSFRQATSTGESLTLESTEDQSGNTARFFRVRVTDMQPEE